MLVSTIGSLLKNKGFVGSGRLTKTEDGADYLDTRMQASTEVKSKGAEKSKGQLKE
jgi:hypothetical protein